jgi:uncharacterized Ntn-hydrolase superfamily protein
VTGAAPAFDCADCGRRIGKRAAHYVVAGRVLCGRCVVRRYLYDDVDHHGTHAGIASVLGMWPARKGGLT